MSQPVWTWAKIQREWLGESTIGLAPRTVVDAFNRAERLLGTDWIASIRPAGTTGAPWTLHVASAGILLGLAEQLPGGDVLIADARAGRSDVWPELEALYLIRKAAPYVTVRVRPKILVGGKPRIPDFSGRDAGMSALSYIEVAAPEYSLEHRRIQSRIADLAGLVEAVLGEYTLEFFLDRAPTDAECLTIASRVPALATVPGAYEEELPAGLGRVFVNQHLPGQIALSDHGDSDPRPRIGAVRAVIEGRVGNGRDIVVRVPYTDERADKLLWKEARQLPHGGAGIVMFRLRRGGDLRGWAAMIKRRFELGHHSRVSATVLFDFGIVPGPQGEESRPSLVIVRNPRAKVSLPLWAERLRMFESPAAPRLVSVARGVRA